MLEKAEILTLLDDDDQLGLLVIVPECLELPGAGTFIDGDHRVHQRPVAGFRREDERLLLKIREADVPLQLLAVVFQGKEFPHGALRDFHNAVVLRLRSAHDFVSEKRGSALHPARFRQHVGDVEKPLKLPLPIRPEELQLHGIHLVSLD